MHLKINQLPFYWRLNNENPNYIEGVKTNYNFSFDFDKKNYVLIQKRQNNVLTALRRIYSEEYNIGYLQEGYDIASGYLKDFVSFIDKSIKNKKINEILEIGCGGCLILKYLKEKNFSVEGIDSNPSAKKTAEKFGIHVIEDFFPSKIIKKKFDLIYHADVLEHIDDFKSFLYEQHKAIKPNGYLIVNVPDNTENIAIGDISMAMHQHLNYFTYDSLKFTLENNGFKVLEITKSNYGGSLYALAKKSTIGKQIINSNKNKLINEHEKFFYNASLIIKNLNNLIKENGNKKFGFYVPLRSLPYICKIREKINYRFFDDTKHWHLRRFDGNQTQIENFQDLINHPVDIVILFSLTFDKIIKKKIEDKIPNIKIITIRDLNY